MVSNTEKAGKSAVLEKRKSESGVKVRDYDGYNISVLKCNVRNGSFLNLEISNFLYLKYPKGILSSFL